MNQPTLPAAPTDQTQPKQKDAATRWRKLLEDQRASGLPISAFCRERGIAAASLFAWRRKLTRGSERAAPLAVAETFKPVTIIAQAEPRRDGGDDGAGSAIELPAASFIELCLRGGRQLMVRRGFDRQLLVDVIHAVESLA